MGSDRSPETEMLRMPSDTRKQWSNLQLCCLLNCQWKCKNDSWVSNHTTHIFFLFSSAGADVKFQLEKISQLFSALGCKLFLSTYVSKCPILMVWPQSNIIYIWFLVGCTVLQNHNFYIRYDFFRHWSLSILEILSKHFSQYIL